MKKALLSIVIGSTLLSVGFANAGAGHQQADATNSAEQHSMMNMDHSKMNMKMDHSNMKMPAMDHSKMMMDMDMDMGHGEMQGHHGAATAGHGSEQSLAGSVGKESEVSRIIEVTADDSMRFFHEPINVKKGETIKFVVTNKGSMVHEFAIGTKGELKKHGQMMMSNPTMKHGAGGNAITIEPSQSMSIIWKFEQAGQVEAACNVPGHYQAGMYSPINFTG